MEFYFLVCFIFLLSFLIQTNTRPCKSIKDCLKDEFCVETICAKTIYRKDTISMREMRSDKFRKENITISDEELERIKEVKETLGEHKKVCGSDVLNKKERKLRGL